MGEAVNTQCIFMGNEPLGYCHTHRRYDCSVFREIDRLREELSIAKKALKLACEKLPQALERDVRIMSCAVSESNQNDQQVICNHIFGHSSVWDRLVYGAEDEMKCVMDNQIDDFFFYEAFIYCPICGVKLNR